MKIIGEMTAWIIGVFALLCLTGLGQGEVKSQWESALNQSK